MTGNFPPRVDTSLSFLGFIKLSKTNVKLYATPLLLLFFSMVAGMLQLSTIMMVVGAVGIVTLLTIVVIEITSHEYNDGIEIIKNNWDYYIGGPYK